MSKAYKVNKLVLIAFLHKTRKTFISLLPSSVWFTHTHSSSSVLRPKSELFSQFSLLNLHLKNSVTTVSNSSIATDRWIGDRTDLNMSL